MQKNDLMKGFEPTACWNEILPCVLVEPLENAYCDPTTPSDE